MATIAWGLQDRWPANHGQTRVSAGSMDISPLIFALQIVKNKHSLPCFSDHGVCKDTLKVGKLETRHRPGRHIAIVVRVLKVGLERPLYLP